MPNQKISQDPNGVALVGTEKIPMIQGGANVNTTPDDIATFVVDGLPAPGIGSLVEDTTPQLGGNLDCNTHSIQNVVAPVAPGDAVNKDYVDDGLGTKADTVHNHVAADVTDFDTAAKAAAVADAINDGTTDVAPSQNAVFDALAGKADTVHTHTASDVTDFVAEARTAAVADAITDGVQNIAPSQNAVFDALAGKQPLDPQLTSVAGLSYVGNAAKVIAVTAGEDGFELVTPSGGGGLLVDDPSPTLGTNMNANGWDISQVNNLQTNFIYMPNNGVIYVKDFAGSGDLNALESNSADQLVLGNGTSGILLGTQTDFNGYEATNLADPVNAQDAATKAYVDANAGGASYVDLISITNLSGLSQLISLPAGYDMFEAVVVGLKINTDGRVVRGRLRRTGSAVDTGNNYTRHEQSIYSGAQQTLSAVPTDGMNLTRSQQDLGINAVMSGKFNIYRPADASIVCWNWQGIYAFIAPTDGPIINTGGMYNNGGVIVDAFEISTAAAAFNAGKVFLYGYKNTI